MSVIAFVMASIGVAVMMLTFLLVAIIAGFLLGAASGGDQHIADTLEKIAMFVRIIQK